MHTHMHVYTHTRAHTHAHAHAHIQNSEEAALGSAVSLTKEEQETRQVMKRIIVKCADISNPLRPMHLCREWAWRIAREYFTQVCLTEPSA